MYRMSEERFREALAAPPIVVQSLQYENPKALAVSQQLQGQNVEFLIHKCNSCPLGEETRRMTYLPVPPSGMLNSYYVMQGRNPGVQEARNHVPFFSGAPGGRYLDIYLSYLNLDRNMCYITNSAFCYRIGDAPPEVEHLERCSLWKMVEMKRLAAPKFIFLFGNDALRSTLNFEHVSIVRVMGRHFIVPNYLGTGSTVYMFPVYHPGSVLRNRSLLEVVKVHLLDIAQRYILEFQTFLESNPSVEDIKKWTL